ncbi:MAG TPA: hypothetical protein VFG59_13590 [Anaeromyxobacter sp.]|nr:hypothetical protein [Anaeromyxobacter sp.]
MSREAIGHVSGDGVLSTRLGPAERLRELLAWAVLAPSRHNTQPWAFDIEGELLSVYADARRALPVTDPDGRELFASCGAVLTNLVLSAAHFGYATSAEVLPGHRRDGLVARVRFEERRPSTPESEELFRAIPRRRTNRMPLDGREPPPGLVAQLVREARREGLSLRPVEEHQRALVAELVSEGDRVQWSNFRWRAELASWTRLSGSPRRDGIPAAAQGLSDLAAFLQPVLTRLRNPAGIEAERDRRRARASRALLVLSSVRDGEADWVAVGEALQRLLLRATAAGLSASYLNSAVEVPGLRVLLREAVGESGLPQVMIRLGYGLEVPVPPRRKVEEVLRRFEPARRRAAAEALCRRAAPFTPSDSASPGVGPS